MSPPQADSPACQLEAATEAEASQIAQACGQPVKVTSMTSETDEVWALPSGGFRLQTAPTPVRAKKDGSWVAVDLTLEASSDGFVRPKAHPEDLVISGARDIEGSYELAAIGRGAKRVAMGWTGKLPTPVLDGATATYPEVSPGVDLVLKVTREGVEQFFIVKNRGAARHVSSLNIPITGANVASHRVDEHGNVTLVDQAGGKIAHVPAPLMWDARVDAATGQPTHVRKMKSRAAARKAKSAKVSRPGDSAGVDLSITPDAAFMDDPATVYPVVVDPTLDPVRPTYDTYVRSTDTVDYSRDASLRWGTYSGGTSRAYVRWNTEALVGARVTSARTWFWNSWSSSCDAKRWEVWTTNGTTSGGVEATTWAAQPAWLYREGSTTQTRGSGTCTAGWINVDSTQLFKRAVDAGQTRASMGIRIGDEADTLAAKTVNSQQSSTSAPYSVVDYEVAITPITGTAVAPNGTPLGGVNLEATVEPTPDQLAAVPAGGEITPVLVGSATTDSAGSFSLPITNFNAMANATTADGLVSVIISAPTTEGQIFYRTRLAFTAATGTLAPYQDDVASEAQGSTTPKSRVSSTSASGGAVMTLVPLQVTPTDVIDNSTPVIPPSEQDTAAANNNEPVAQSVEPEWSEYPRTDRPAYAPPSQSSSGTATASGVWEPDVWCSGHHWYRRKSKDVMPRNIALANQSTGGSAKGEFKYETTASLDLEVGVTNSAGSLVASLGMADSSTRTASIESSIGNKVNAEWWISYEFNIYDYMCQNRQTGVKWWSGYSEYKPKGFTGSASRRKWTPFRCNTAYETFFGPGYKAVVSNGKTATRNGSFSMGKALAGNLKIAQKWGATQTVTYTANDSNTSYKLCGGGKKWFEGVSMTRQT